MVVCARVRGVNELLLANCSLSGHQRLGGNVGMEEFHHHLRKRRRPHQTERAAEAVRPQGIHGHRQATGSQRQQQVTCGRR